MLGEIKHICTICKEWKSLNDFYKNKLMPSGYLNQCKDCVKSRAKKRHHELSKNPEWLDKERKRHREKYYRLNYKDMQKEWDKDRPWKGTATYKNLKRDASVKFNIPKTHELHHWNYNYLKCFFTLNKSLHKKIHTLLEFDNETLCYKHNNKLLDTKQKHGLFIIGYCEKNNITTSIGWYQL
jgi:hypothetical protein